MKVFVGVGGELRVNLSLSPLQPSFLEDRVSKLGFWGLGFMGGGLGERLG